MSKIKKDLPGSIISVLALCFICATNVYAGDYADTLRPPVGGGIGKLEEAQGITKDDTEGQQPAAGQTIKPVRVDRLGSLAEKGKSPATNQDITLLRIAIAAIEGGNNIVEIRDKVLRQIDLTNLDDELRVSVGELIEQIDILDERAKFAVYDMNLYSGLSIELASTSVNMAWGYINDTLRNIKDMLASLQGQSFARGHTVRGAAGIDRSPIPVVTGL